MQTHIEVRGVKELQQAFRKIDKKLKRELQKELRKIAEPAAGKARAIAVSKGLSTRTVSGIRPGSRVGMAVVRQIRRKTTGKRPDIGPLLMERVMEPAAVETMPEAVLRLEMMLDRVANWGQSD